MEEWYWCHGVLSTLTYRQPSATTGSASQQPLSFSDFSVDTNSAAVSMKGAQGPHAEVYFVNKCRNPHCCSSGEFLPTLGYRLILTGWHGISSMVCLPGKPFPIFVLLRTSRSWHWWRLGRIRGWFVSGLTKHVFTITPFIMTCLRKTAFLEFAHVPWVLPPKRLKQIRQEIHCLSSIAGATELSNS